MSVTLPSPNAPKIPDYLLIRCIGSGSYGDVWLAKGITGIYRAIKVIWQERFPESSPFDREYLGVQEFARISLLDNNQLAILHIGRNDDHTGVYFYYVMELADDLEKGVEIDPLSYRPYTLREKLKQGEVLGIPSTINVAINLAQALATLHSHGLVHRDVKPSNILIVNGLPKLADIGLVSALDEEMTFVGTEGYIPPEGPGKVQADIFGLGKVIYELATGLNRRDHPKLPDDLVERKDVKELLELNEILLRACDPDPGRRYQNADELKQALLLVQAGKSIRRLYTAERGLRHAIRIVFVLGIVAIFGFTGAFVERKRAEASEQLIGYAAGLIQARDAIEREDYGSARKHLSELRPRMLGEYERGFEWRALNHLAKGDRAEVIRTGGPRILKIEPVNENSAYAIHDTSHRLELRDFFTNQVLESITGVQSLIGVTSDSKWYVGLGKNYQFARWSILSGGDIEAIESSPKHLYPLGLDRRGHAYAVDRSKDTALVELSIDGQLFNHSLIEKSSSLKKWEFFRGAISDDGNAVFAWVNLEQSIPLFCVSYWSQGNEHVFFDIDQRPSSVGFDSKGAWIVAALTGEEWRIGDDLVLTQSQQIFPKSLIARVESPNGKSVFCARERVYSSSGNGTSPIVLRGHASEVTSVVSMNDWIISGSSSGEIRRWSLVGNRESSLNSYQSLQSNGHMVNLEFLDDERIIVPGSEGFSVVLNRSNLEEVDRVLGLRTPIVRHKNELFGIGKTGFGIWNSQNYELLTSLSKRPTMYLNYATKSGEFFSVDRGGLLWRTTKEDDVEKLDIGWRKQFDFEVSENGDVIWSISTDSNLMCWDTHTKSSRWNIHLEALASSIEVDEKLKVLFIVLNDGTLEKRNLSSGRLIAKIPSGSSYPESVCVDQQRNRLIIGDRNGGIQVFTADELQFLIRLNLPENRIIYDMEIAPDGASLATIGSNGFVQMIEAPFN